MKIDANFISLCQAVLADRLEQLSQAASLLEQQTIPETPMPRTRVFALTPTTVWPNDRNLRSVDINRPIPSNVPLIFTGQNRHSVARELLQECKGQPARIAYTVEQLDAAIRWCKDRTEGRKRAAEEIVRQQGRAVSRLIPVVVAKKLKGCHG